MSSGQTQTPPAAAEQGDATLSMVAAIAEMLADLRHVAVGASSPIPATAALLARARSGGRLRVSLLGSADNNPFTDGGKELFDCAAQGRIDAFFLSGGQIDGQGNINLMGIGAYPDLKARFPGTFGSAYLFHLIPRVILFREEHTPRTLVERVDFVSAAGTSAPGTYRVGGPYALVTGLGVFRFDREAGGFELTATHPGVAPEAVAERTGFAYRVANPVTQSPGLSAGDRTLLRDQIAGEVAEIYPQFAESVLAQRANTPVGDSSSLAQRANTPVGD